MSRARFLRKNATDCERLFWRRLRNRHFEQFKFRRQHPVDPYTLDFYCPTLKLAIELDGGGHAYPGQKIRDKDRDSFLNAKGIASVRFWNHQIYEDLDNVMHAIWLAIQKRIAENPSPQSSPFSKGRGGAARPAS